MDLSNRMFPSIVSCTLLDAVGSVAVNFAALDGGPSLGEEAPVADSLGFLLQLCELVVFVL